MGADKGGSYFGLTLTIFSESGARQCAGPGQSSQKSRLCDRVASVDRALQQLRRHRAKIR